MAYSLSFAFGLDAGLTLEAQFIDTANVNSGAAITTGIVEIDSGWYLATLSIPAAQRGGVKFRLAGGGPTLAFFAINPEEGEIIAEVHGLLGKHQRTANAVYSGSELMSYEVRLFDTAAHAQGDNGTTTATGLLHRYAVANTYGTGGIFLTSMMTKLT